MSELKPCPFCGGEAKVLRADIPFYRTNKEGWYVMCLGRACSAELGFGGQDYQGVAGEFGTEAEAIEAWNTRAEHTCGLRSRFTGMYCYECSECRSGMKPDWSFCPSCGARVVE